MRAMSVFLLTTLSACVGIAGLDGLVFEEGAGGAGGEETGGGGSGASGGEATGGADPGTTTALFYFEGDGTNARVMAHDFETGVATPVSCAMDDALLGGAIPAAVFAIENRRATSPDMAPAVAFVDLDDSGDGNRALFIADPTSDCDDNPPRRIDLQPRVGELIVAPRFSPDGSRVAYLEGIEATPIIDVLRVVTVNIDGTEPRVLRSEQALSEGSIFPAPPAWKSAPTEVAWVELSSNEVRVQFAEDVAFAAPMPRLTCPSSAFAFIAQLELFTLEGSPKIGLVAQFAGTGMGAGTGAGDHGIFITDASADCATLAEVFSSDPESVVAKDFALSPDQTVMAHHANRGGTEGIQLWLSEPDGDGLTRCDEDADPAFEAGATWLAGGTQLAWTRSSLAPPYDGDIMIADVEGTTCSNIRPLRRDPPSEGGTRLLGYRGTCSGSPAPDSGSHAPWVLAMGAAWVAARRRRTG